MRWTCPLAFALCLASLAHAQEAPAPAPAKNAETDALRAAFDARAKEAAAKRVMRLGIREVGRLALRNDPNFRTRSLDPEIARAAVDEAWAEFDTLFAANAAYGRARNQSRFALTSGGSVSTVIVEPERDLISSGVGLGQKQTWGGSWSLGYDQTSRNERGDFPSSFEPRYQGILSLGYRHPFLRGAGRDVTLSREREAAEQVRASESELRRQAETTVANSESAYWQLVGAIADRMVRRKSLEVAEELLTISEARLRSGRGIRVEVTEARAGVESRKVELIQADTSVENRTDRLREAILPFTPESDDAGLDLDLILVPEDTPGVDLGDLPKEPDAAGLEKVLAGRADVRAATASVDASRIAEGRARDDTLGQLDAFTGAGLTGKGSGFNDASDQIGDRDIYSWEIGLEFSIPLGNELAESRLRRARTVTLRASRSLRALQNSVVREIREATRNVVSTARQIEAAKRSRQATEDQLAAERSRLENGAVTPFDVLQVEEDLSEARVREIRARIDYELARVSLELAVGTILESRELVHLVEPK